MITRVVSNEAMFSSSFSEDLMNIFRLSEDVLLHLLYVNVFARRTHCAIRRLDWSEHIRDRDENGITTKS